MAIDATFVLHIPCSTDPEPGAQAPSSLPKFLVDAILSREYSLPQLRLRFGVEPGLAMKVRAAFARGKTLDGRPDGGHEG